MNAPLIEVSQLWGDSLLRVERFPRWRRLTVGPGSASHFAAALDAPTVLVERGSIHSDGGTVEITADTDVCVDVGEQTFRVRAVAAERPVGGALLAHVDWLFMGVVLVTGITLLLAAIVVVLSVLAFTLLRLLLAILFASAGIALPVFLQVPPPPVPVPAVVATAVIEPPSAPAPPLFVKPTPKPVPTIAPIPIGDVKPKKQTRQRDAVLNAMDTLSRDNVAILGVLSSSRHEELADVFGEPRGVEGGVTGGVVGGVLGGSPGGGAVGIGGLGTRGTGVGGGGTAAGIGSGRLSAGAGSLSREQISSTLGRHLPEIRRCYERALSAAPELEGKVVVSFQVDSTGRVRGAHVVRSTLSDAVDACVLDALREIQFPIPSGEGSVSVTYPFSFVIAAD